MQRNKINDCFEFPMQLDVSPYKVESLDDSSAVIAEDMFDLVGILVHMGTAESGHYFSYIKIAPERPGVAARWLEFNDADVIEFDPSRIADLCFGGWTDIEQLGAECPAGVLPKPWNAYMLFYQRLSSLGTCQADNLDATHAKVELPGDLQDEIASDNEVRLREFSLFDQHHTYFVRNLLQQLRTLGNGICSDDHQVERDAIYLALEHTHYVVSRTKDISELEALMALLRRTTKTCANCVHLALGWIASHPFAVRNQLLRSPNPKVRSEIGQFIVQSLLTLRSEDPVLYGFDVNEPEFESVTVAAADSGALPAIIETLTQLIGQLAINAKPWDDYFGLLCEISSFGIHEATYILHKGFLLDCLEILVVHGEPDIRQKHAQLWRCIDKRKPSHNKLIELVHVLLARIDLGASATGEPEKRIEPSSKSTNQYALLEAEKAMIMLWDPREKHNVILARMLDIWEMNSSDRFVPGEVLARLLTAEPGLGLLADLFTTIHDGIETLFPQYVEPYLKAAIYFCANCPRSTEAVKVVMAAIRSPSQVENHLGQAHVDFFRSIVSVENDHIAAAEGHFFFYYLVLEHVTEWAPPLLLFEESEVQIAAADLLFSFLFQNSPHSSSSTIGEAKRSVAVRRLLAECIERIKLACDANVNRHRIRMMLEILRSGTRWLEMLAHSDRPEEARQERTHDAELARKCRGMHTHR